MAQEVEAKGDDMKTTRIPGISGVYACHTSHQRPVEGVAVYRYTYHWACEVDGPWRPWLPGSGVPCEHIQGALELESKHEDPLMQQAFRERIALFAQRHPQANLNSSAIQRRLVQVCAEEVHHE